MINKSDANRRVWMTSTNYLPLKEHLGTKSFVNVTCRFLKSYGGCVWEGSFSDFPTLLFCRWEKTGEVSRELWEKAGKQGLLGVNIAEQHGGIGGDLYSAAVVWEEQ